MHTIACARAHEDACTCACNHTLHGYLSGVLSTEQHRRVREPIAAGVAAASDKSLHAEQALRELDSLLGSASRHLAAGALDNDTLEALVTTVLDASAEQREADRGSVAAAEAAERDAERRAAEAESRAASAIDSAAMAVAAAEDDADRARAVAAEAMRREGQAEAAAAWALGELHLMCGLCVAGVAQVQAAEDDATIAVAEFLEATLGPSSAMPLGDADLEAVRSSVQDVLGEEAARSLLTLDSLPSEGDLMVLAIAFCPDPSLHPEVVRFQQTLTQSMVSSIVTGS